MATTEDHLRTAVRFLLAMRRLRSLKRLQSINRKATNARSCVDDISTEANALRDEIKNALVTIEDAIRTAEASAA